MKSIVAVLPLLVLGACATGGMPQTPQQVMQAYCTVSTPEIAAFQADAALFTPQVQKALKVVTPLNTALCSPTAITGATQADIQTYLAQVLPALTTIAIEFAAVQKAAAKSLPADMVPAPILGVQ